MHDGLVPSQYVRGASTTCRLSTSHETTLPRTDRGAAADAAIWIPGASFLASHAPGIPSVLTLTALAAGTGWFWPVLNVAVAAVVLAEVAPAEAGKAKLPSKATQATQTLQTTRLVPVSPPHPLRPAMVAKVMPAVRMAVPARMPLQDSDETASARRSRGGLFFRGPRGAAASEPANSIFLATFQNDSGRQNERPARSP
jgi:hypothetical protein